MDEDREKRVHDEIGEVDKFSSLPDSLICEILLNIPTKDVVKTSVLSSRWRNLYKLVPSLELEYSEFPEFKVFANFVDKFLGFDSESIIHKFKLEYDWNDGDDDNHTAHVAPWISNVLKRKVQHLHVLDCCYPEQVEIPPAVYVCDSLVSLNLCCVTLPSPEFVALPSVKEIYLDRVKFTDDSAFDMLVSGCAVLGCLTVKRSSRDNVKVLRVCSNSLLSLTLVGHGDEFVDKYLVVEIDAPKLKYLELSDHDTSSFIVNNLGSLVKVDIDIEFNLCYGQRFNPNDLPKRNMIHNFLVGISSVQEMAISPFTLEVLYSYMKCQSLPVFHNLSFLRTTDYKWQMLPVFLNTCPNLKSLVLRSSGYLNTEGIRIISGRRFLLSSLEYVEIEVNPMKLIPVSYFLENATILKKLTICLGDNGKKEASIILEKLSTFPRRSTLCQVVVQNNAGHLFTM